MLVLALPAGQLADRVSRRLIMAVALALEIARDERADRRQPRRRDAALALPGARDGHRVRDRDRQPAVARTAAVLVPLDLIASAMALRSIAFQVAVVAGPALGGFLFALRPEIAYGTATGLLFVGLVCVLLLHVPRTAPSSEAPGLASVLAGIRFIRRTKVLLGAITLDLFAVLFGGAIALAPVFARTILHVGPVGLGLLRSAPAVGALVAAALLTRRPLRGHAGRTLLVVVAAFGVSMIVFGLSRSLPLSLAALAVSGFVDLVSVNIRATIVAVATPGRAPRARARGRDGVHQRLERARRLRVRRRGGAARRRAGRRRRGRPDDRPRRRLAVGVPGAGPDRPARGPVPEPAGAAGGAR